MSDSIKTTGKCLCGATGISVELASASVGACHCSMCRQWGGGPFMTVDGGTAVSISGPQSVTRFNSSDWAERGFCKHCGTHLYYRLKGNGQYFLPAGLLELDARAKFDHQVFIDEKPHFYSFSNDTRDMTGAELFAMFTTDKE